VTGAAAPAAVINAAAAFATGNARVRTNIARRGPGASIVAHRTGLPAEHARVESRVFVATGTFAGCAFENIIDVAFITGNAGMSAIQLEG